jgi:DNA invertase Pin-like site-specific DNA recombinase
VKNSKKSNNGKYVAYYRVSTEQQGKSGLGLEAQQATVRNYLNGGTWELLAEFQEAESGKNDNRPELAKALALCKRHRSKLIVAKVDRLTRSASFLHKLLDVGVDVMFCDLPQIDGPIGRFLLQQLVNVAELEAGFIGQRTKAALSAAKSRGTNLGGWRPMRRDGSARNYAHLLPGGAPAGYRSDCGGC